MYIFFTIFGFIFICIAAILINYIYTVFSINRFTNFLYPTDSRNVFNEISLTILPIIIWGFVELPIIGGNNNFIIALILNIIVSCSIIYEIKYGVYILLKKENSFIDVLAIIFATFFGQMISYMILKSNSFISFNNYSFVISILGVVCLLVVYSIFIFKIPIFKKKLKEYEEKR